MVSSVITNALVKIADNLIALVWDPLNLIATLVSHGLLEVKK